jgi:peptidoglycan/LPS O-acetylase OafA/YrhL
LLAFRLFERLRATPWAARTAALAAGLVLAVLAMQASPAALPLSQPGNPGVLLFGFAFAALCLWQALRPSWLLRSRPALWLGERSYSIYLSHFLLILALRPVYARLGEVLGDGGATFLAAVAVTLPPLLLAAALGYRFVERPGIALGRRVIRWLEASRGGKALQADATRETSALPR